MTQLQKTAKMKQKHTKEVLFTKLQKYEKTPKMKQKQKTIHKRGVFYKITKNRKRKYLRFGSQLLNQIRIRSVQHLKMNFGTSVL